MSSVNTNESLLRIRAIGSAGQDGHYGPKLWAAGRFHQVGLVVRGAGVEAAAGQMAAGSCLEALLWDVILTVVEWVVSKQAPMLRGEMSFCRKVLCGICQDVRLFKVMIFIYGHDRER